MSLAVVFLNAASGSVAYAKMKRIDYRSGLIFAIATLPGSVIGALVTGLIPRQVFNVILGCLLVVIAVFLFLRPTEGAYAVHSVKGLKVHRVVRDIYTKVYRYTFNPWAGIVLSFFVGFLSSLLGIGGGIIHVPALSSLLNFPIHIATATSHLILAIMALAGTVVHMIQGTFWVQWQKTLLIGLGVVAGAQLGARFSEKVKPSGIIIALSVALLLVGLRLIFF
jgi:uncharacterized membrane protein YfcA